MQLDQVPRALQARLGDDATVALLELLDASHREAREPLIAACTERFERRLVEEVAGLRVQNAEQGAALRHETLTLGAGLRQEMATMGAELRQEMATMGAELRQEMATMGAELRQEMATMGAELRQEMATMGAELRQEIAAGRVELIKWSFLFWIGQVLAITAIMGVMLRVMR
jgi:tRNA U54 and U55 pseudouridine synthase Pus10